MSDNPLDLDELERLAKAATPGPWKRCSPPLRRTFVAAPDSRGSRPVHLQVTEPCSEDDATYIAAANPATLLALIKRLREAEMSEDEIALLPWKPDYKCGSGRGWGPDD